MTQGDKVQIINPEGREKCLWWPQGIVMGEITQMHKNGKITVAMNNLKSPKRHGKMYQTFQPESLKQVS